MAVVMSLNTSVTDLGPQNVIAEARVGGNGNPYGSPEYDVGSNSDDLTYGFAEWDNSNLSDGFDTPNVAFRLDATAAGSTWGITDGINGTLDSESGTGGTINQVIIRIDAQSPNMEGTLSRLCVSFYQDGVLTETDSIGTMETQTSDEEPVVEEMATITPSSLDNDQVVVTGILNFSCAQPYELPDPNDIFCQIAVS